MSDSKSYADRSKRAFRRLARASLLGPRRHAKSGACAMTPVSAALILGEEIGAANQLKLMGHDHLSKKELARMRAVSRAAMRDALHLDRVCANVTAAARRAGLSGLKKSRRKRRK